MTVAEDGNVGIGTNAPSVQNGTLVIGGTSTTNSTAQGSIVFGDAGNSGQSRIRGYRGTGFTRGALAFETAQGTANTYVEAMRIDQNGNVGIGEVASSDARLQVRTTAADARLRVRCTSGTSLDAVLELLATSSNGAQGYSAIKGIGTGGANGQMSFHTGNSSLPERMRIDSSGNVGIGTPPKFFISHGLR